MTTLPPKITTLQANWYSSRQDQKIQAIVVHDTERPSDDSNSINYLKRGGDLPSGLDRKVSIHVLVQEDGSSYVYLSDTVAANHAGYSTLKINNKIYSPDKNHYNVNTCTLGIELERTKGTTKAYPADQLLSAGYWITIWRKRHGNLQLVRHGDIDPTRRSDPVGLTVAQLEAYTWQAERILNAVPTPENPIAYRVLVPQVVYTARSLDSAFATGDDLPYKVLSANEVVQIGDITGDWAWIATGIGFVPKRTLIKVTNNG